MIVKVEESNFKTEVLQENRALVLKMYTQNCSNCNKIAPVFLSLASKHSLKYKFCEWEVISKSNVLKQYKVMAVPTLLFFKNGKLIHRKVGVMSEKRIINYLEKINKINKSEIEKNELKGLIDWSFLKFWE